MYRATDLQNGRSVALKVLYLPQALVNRSFELKVLSPLELVADPRFVRRFQQEARADANLSHPNIVSVVDWGRTPGPTSS